MEDDRYSINSKFVNLIYNDEYRGLYLLKEIVKESVKYNNGKIVMGGDNNASEIALIPLEDIANGF